MKDIPGYSACLCSICGETFTVVANFDRHLIRDRDPRGSVVRVRCQNPSNVGLVINKRGIWAQPSDGLPVSVLRRSARRGAK